MLLANPKEKAIKWRKAAEAYEQEGISGCVVYHRSIKAI